MTYQHFKEILRIFTKKKYFTVIQKIYKVKSKRNDASQRCKKEKQTVHPHISHCAHQKQGQRKDFRSVDFFPLALRAAGKLHKSHTITTQTHTHTYTLVPQIPAQTDTQTNLEDISKKKPHPYIFAITCSTSFSYLFLSL